MAQILLIVGSLIFGLLGVIHLSYTFLSNKFDPYNLEVKSAMKNTSPLLSKETSMWSAWVGFNASHSAGAILVALLFLPLSIYYNEVIQNSLWFSLLPVFIGICYLVLAIKYWFKIPVVAISMATLCFLGAAVGYNV